MQREQETQAALDDIEIKNLELQAQKEALQHVCFVYWTLMFQAIDVCPVSCVTPSPFSQQGQKNGVGWEEWSILYPNLPCVAVAAIFMN